MTTAEEAMRDLKVKIPLNYYVQLHTLKILRGKNMADALCEALDLYFANPANAHLREAALESLRT